jgi:ipoprotein LpqH
MKRGLVVAAAGAAILAVGMTGCSKDKSSESGSSATASASASVPGGGNTSAGSGTAKVTIDGKAQDVQGQIGCTTTGGNVVIAIGNATGGIGATLTDADPPVVKTVGLGNVGGTALGYTEGAPGGEAKATKDGKTYKISGTATGVDMANPMQPANKPFEIEVTCP